ncbi:ATP-binding protein [Sutterella sp.]|uniref:sensor histidine kinase n=1 Tax=Sutterella sp. TaxID=1981025 RepID=UPI0026E04647|nr:ATP-binding protein [Sutterella sp.]MDO5530395.1 ATP-binding protein [Sutterella sp.]
MTSWLRGLFAASLVLAGISLFVLAATSSDTTLFERWFPVLLVINRVIAVVLFGIVVAMALRLWQRHRNHEFGVFMTTRLAISAGVLALVPCLLIYFVSTVFITRSINSWFDVRVEKALDSGVTITRGLLAEQQAVTEKTAREIADQLSSTPASLIMSDLMRILETRPGTEALVFLPNGTAVAAAGSRLNVLMPEVPTVSQIQAVKASGIYSVIDGDAFENFDALREGKLSIRVIVPIQPLDEETGTPEDPAALGLRRQQLYLQIIQPVPTETTKNAAMLVAGYREYQTLVLSRASLQSVYASTLFLVMLLAALGAFVVSFAFARRTVAPLLQLEQGTRRVADGNFQPIREYQGQEEINALTQSFNQMIRELSESRRVIDEQRRRAEQAQAYLERVLVNISSGVLVLGSDYRVITSNTAARDILGDAACRRDADIRALVPALFGAIRSAELSLGLGADPGAASLEFELERPGEETVPIYLKLARMPLGESETGLVVVFDDISKIIEAQRATAWGEVARRLAHEIKNPLTPIQLAAERLLLRLEPKLTSDADCDMLEHTVNTITTQVDALKQMVNDFREYAKLPEAKLVPMDLNAFLRSISALYQEAGISLTLDLCEDIPLIEGDQAQLRQVMHNLITNSIDAAEGDTPRIVIETRRVLTERAMSAVQLHFHDSGVGFSENILERAFEPYVTTKATGTGLGLPMVKKILDEHRAAVRLSNRTDPSGTLILGAQIDILFEHLAPGDAAARGPAEEQA